MNVMRLGGCAPAPLAHYLKALGILRIVAEQCDANARGWWDGESFVLATKLGREELIEFILERYRPTPVFNPWGARSGFYAGSSEKSSREVLDTIEASGDPRFAEYRAVIAQVRSAVAEVAGGTKPEDELTKRAFVLALKREVRGKGSEWLDSVLAILESSSKAFEQPALFGTGGSEGSGSYTAAYMSAIHECLIDRSWDHALSDSLFSGSKEFGNRWGEPFGQFLPTNHGTPWDFLLAFEGGCEVRSSVVARSASSSDRWMASPFFVAPVASGFPSGARLDEYVLNKGKELPGRGEQWFPLWRNPLTRQELSKLFRDGRSVTKRSAANDGWSMARAAKNLGVQQGITAFVRTAYLQRNNLATHYAVALSRVTVSQVTSSSSSCLDDVDSWVGRLRREARSKSAPARFVAVVRRLVGSLFSVNDHLDEPSRWQDLLLRLADVEAVQITGRGFAAGPIPPLRSEWVMAADDGSVEFRLALACARQRGRFPRSHAELEGMRRHWLPLDGSRYRTTGTGGEKRLRVTNDQVMRGRDGIEDAIAIVSRRIIEASQSGERRLALDGEHAFASPSDLSAFLDGDVDADRILHLARALMAIYRRGWHPSAAAAAASPDTGNPDDVWIAIRLAALPWPLGDRRLIGIDPAMVRRLAAGDAASAFRLARLRLRGAGIHTPLRETAVSAEVSRRWAAALVFPISMRTASRFLAQLDPNSRKEE